MTNVTFERVVSFSSEDPKFPAQNLLKFGGGTWKCRTSGEANATIILQLCKPCRIHSADIGNAGSAFVHVLVGRAASADDDFQTLLPASSFMTAEESSRGSICDRVRMFTRDNFLEPTASERWDRVKVVCSQPFNRRLQYGLAFFVMRSDDNVVKPAPTVPSGPLVPASVGLGRFQLKKDDSDGLAVGSLFARMRGSHTSGDEPARRTSFLSSEESPGQTEKKKDPVTVHNGTSTHVGKAPQRASRSPSPSPPSPPPKVRAKVAQPLKPALAPKQAKVAKPTEKVKASPASDKAKRPSAPADPPPSAPKRVKTPAAGPSPSTSKKGKPAAAAPAAPRKPSKPFSQLLEGVVLVLSGFVNPLRSQLRSQALDMGAKYRQDWDASCTHLICAFKNTPKFRQVQGQGKIVQKDWIEQCHSKRRRIPWRRFALDLDDFKKPESEEEIVEEVPVPSSSSQDSPEELSEEAEMNTTTGCKAESGSDTEDEIERLQRSSVSRVYLTDTEEDDDDDSSTRPDVSHLPMPPLPQ